MKAIAEHTITVSKLKDGEIFTDGDQKYMKTLILVSLIHRLGVMKSSFSDSRKVEKIVIRK